MRGFAPRSASKRRRCIHAPDRAQNTRVVQVSTPVAGVAEIHEMSMTAT